MLAVLLAWALMGIPEGPIEAVTPSSVVATSREWTDVSGTKRVQATLVRAEGGRLWLRRPDGNLATTTLAELSPTDRQFVTTNQHDNANPKSTDVSPASLTTTLAQKVGDVLTSTIQAPDWSSPSQLEVPMRLVPAAVVYVRVSRSFLEDYVEREVNRTKPVHDYILGTRITGESDTVGQTRLELLPGSGRLAGKISFEGTVHARTLGHNGPVVLHQLAHSTFEVSKKIELSNSGLQVSSSVGNAPTRLETTNITTCLPHLRGRIATRIAWKRLTASNDEAEAITANHTAAIINTDFDKSTNATVAKLQAMFKAKIPDINVDQGSLLAEVRFRTNADSVEMAMIRIDAGLEEHKLRPPMVEGNPDVAVRVHRTLLVRAIADPQVREDLTPLLAKLLQTRITVKELRKIEDEGLRLAESTKWSIDPDWLTLDFTDSSR